MDLSKTRKCRLKEIAKISRATSGQIYPKGTNWIELSATKGRVGIIDRDGLIETRNAVIIPVIPINPFYFHLVLERALPRFVSKYLTTINLQADVVGLMEIEYHTEAEAQNIVVHSMNQINQWIDEENDALEKWQRIKRAMLGNLFA